MNCKSIFLALSLLLLPVLAHGQPPDFISCRTEREKYCSSDTKPDNVLMFLYKRMQDLSLECKQELQRIGEARKQADEDGGGALTGFGGGMMNLIGAPVPLISYEGHFIPDNGKSNKQIENRFNLSVPIYKTQTRSIGLKQLQGGKSWSIKGAVGYAGDDPSRAQKDDSYSFIATYGFPGSGTDYWALFIFMANNSQLANYVPIPGFVYIHRTEHFTGVFGFPVVSMQWTPVDPWMFSLSVFAFTAQAEAAYGRAKSLQGFFAYGFVQQSYIPSERDNAGDRFYVHEQKVGPGVRKLLGKKALLEAQAGWSFDRSVNVGRSIFSTAGGYASFDPGWFGNVILNTRSSLHGIGSTFAVLGGMRAVFTSFFLLVSCNAFAANIWQQLREKSLLTNQSSSTKRSDLCGIAASVNLAQGLAAQLNLQPIESPHELLENLAKNYPSVTDDIGLSEISQTLRSILLQSMPKTKFKIDAALLDRYVEKNMSSIRPVEQLTETDLTPGSNEAKILIINLFDGEGNYIGGHAIVAESLLDGELKFVNSFEPLADSRARTFATQGSMWKGHQIPTFKILSPTPASLSAAHAFFVSAVISVKKVD